MGSMLRNTAANWYWDFPLINFSVHEPGTLLRVSRFPLLLKVILLSEIFFQILSHLLAFFISFSYLQYHYRKQLICFFSNQLVFYLLAFGDFEVTVVPSSFKLKKCLSDTSAAIQTRIFPVIINVINHDHSLAERLELQVITFDLKHQKSHVNILPQLYGCGMLGARLLDLSSEVCTALYHTSCSGTAYCESIPGE